MPRDIQDLEAHAVKFWPTVLAEREQTTSIIPRLIESQEKFISILYVADASPYAWKEVLQQTTGMPGNLFLKHLIVLSDLGGEKLQRYYTGLRSFFPKGIMNFRWKNANYIYSFRSPSGNSHWTNASLRVSGAEMSKPAELSPEMEDVTMLLVHGGASTNPRVPDDIQSRCIIGSLLGRKKELDSFVRQRYIHVSRITGGATANTMGQLCQSYVHERLRSQLPGWTFSRHTIPGISQNAGHTDMSFDTVAQSPSGRCCAIEVSFQVTTNSTIERKAGQAEARWRLLHENGHKIAYVIDGAGNFQRRSALRTIAAHSDCIVSFSNEELDRLVVFLKTLK